MHNDKSYKNNIVNSQWKADSLWFGSKTIEFSFPINYYVLESTFFDSKSNSLFIKRDT